VKIKATSLIDSNVILYSNSFNVEIVSSYYPYFDSQIKHVKVYWFQTLSYSIPALDNADDFTYTL
jgi:hypothetical protein